MGTLRKKKSGSRDLEVHRSVPAPFLTKTYELVEDGSTDEIVSWNGNGSTFVVWRAAEFASDILPNYFKHNNFSSFVRQLNTYGFKKIAQDRWEFSNEFFQRGKKEFLVEIRRRKTLVVTQIPSTEKTILPVSITSNSGEDQGSSSTSSPANPTWKCGDNNTGNFLELSDENEKLKKENTMLSAELVHIKKQCEELLNFLSGHINVAGMMEGEGSFYPGLLTGPHNPTPSSSNDVGSLKLEKEEEEEDDDDDDDEQGHGERLKLFGVSLKVFQGKKRGQHMDRKGEPHLKKLKMDLEAPWMKLSFPGGSKLCN